MTNESKTELTWLPLAGDEGQFARRPDGGQYVIHNQRNAHKLFSVFFYKTMGAGPKKVGQGPTMAQAQQAALDHSNGVSPVTSDTKLAQVEAAVRDYHLALDNHEHADVAANAALHKIREILNLPWVQGQEKARREGTDK